MQNVAWPELHALGCAGGQTHLEAEHCWPAGHTLPQRPQLLASSVVSWQPVSTQLPDRQASLLEQTFPQAPQLPGSYLKSVQ